MTRLNINPCPNVADCGIDPDSTLCERCFVESPQTGDFASFAIKATQDTVEEVRAAMEKGGRN